MSRLTLRNLLLLDAGTLDPIETERVRAEIRGDVNYLRAWELVCRTTRELQFQVEIAAPYRSADFELDSEIIGAYLDGTLEKQEQKLLERKAIRSPRLLKELVLHFRQQIETPTDNLVPWSVTERLFRVGQSLERSSSVERERLVAMAPLSGTSYETRTAISVEIPMARTVTHVSALKSKSWLRNRRFLALTSVVAGLVGIVWLVSGLYQGGIEWRRDPEVVRAEPLSVSKLLTVESESPSPVATNRARALLKGPPPAETRRSGDWALVSLDESPNSDFEQTSSPPDPDASVFHQHKGVLEDLVWLQLEGIVALRESGQKIWFGPRASGRIMNGLEWQTLPSSWVAARLGTLGEIVLDADSSAVVSASKEKRLIGLEMQSGRVALKRLPIGALVQIKYDRLQWNIEILTEGTALGLDWQDGAPRLSVFAGSARAKDQVILNRQQLVWTLVTGEGSSVLSGSPKVSAISESFGWLDRPVKTVVLPKNEHAELLASVNVVEDLNRLGTASPPSERVLAQYLPAVLSPEAHLLGVLEGAEQKSREEALQWLMNLSPRNVKTRQLWRTIADKSGAPEYTREFFRLVQLAGNSVPMSESDAIFLTSGLKHQRLFVREMSQLLLEVQFGDSSRYDAADEASARNTAADLWTKQILEAYKSAAMPKR